MPNKYIVCNLRNILDAGGISNAELAARSGVTTTTLLSWMKMISYPRLDMAYRVSEVLGIPVEKIWKTIEY